MGILGDLEDAGDSVLHAGQDVVKAGFQLTGDTVRGAEGLLKDLSEHVGTPTELAEQLKQMAAQLELLGRQLTQDAAKVTWQGQAADSFRQHTAQLSQQFAQVSSELGDAAGLAATLV